MLKNTLRICMLSVLCLTMGAASQAFAFDWQKHKGETITFISANHPWANAVLKYADEFTQLTGIKLKIDSFQEQQARQRMRQGRGLARVAGAAVVAGGQLHLLDCCRVDCFKNSMIRSDKS